MGSFSRWKARLLPLFEALSLPSTLNCPLLFPRNDRVGYPSRSCPRKKRNFRACGGRINPMTLFRQGGAEVCPRVSRTFPSPGPGQPTREAFCARLSSRESRDLSDDRAVLLLPFFLSPPFFAFRARTRPGIQSERFGPCFFPPPELTVWSLLKGREFVSPDTTPPYLQSKRFLILSEPLRPQGSCSGARRTVFFPSRRSAWPFLPDAETSPNVALGLFFF